MNPHFHTIVDFAAYAAVRILVAIIQTLPVDMGDSMCRGLAWVISEKTRVRRRETDHNLDAIFPEATEAERSALRRAMWHHLLLMVCEIAWTRRRLHLCNWTQYVQFSGNRELLARTLDTRPTVMVTGHFGNFEVGGYMSGLMGIPTLAIARQLDNRFLHAWVERFRSAKGQSMVDKEGCAPVVQRHLDRGGVLSLLADQHAGPKGCWVDFLGVPASCHKALALFSLSSDAPMLVGSTRRIGGEAMQFQITAHAIADPASDHDTCAGVASLTKWYNEQLAAAVGESIEQYWWLHRRWREPPPRVAKRLAA